MILLGYAHTARMQTLSARTQRKKMGENSLYYLGKISRLRTTSKTWLLFCSLTIFGLDCKLALLKSVLLVK